MVLGLQLYRKMEADRKREEEEYDRARREEIIEFQQAALQKMLDNKEIDQRTFDRIMQVLSGSNNNLAPY